MCERDFVHNFEDAWPETGVQPEGRIDDHGSDFILFHSSKPALLSTAGERKIFAPFWDLNLDTPAWAGGTNQTKQGNEFHARTRRRKNWRGKIRFWETFAPWPLCVSL
jgi:hypothetical protein